MSNYRQPNFDRVANVYDICKMLMLCGSIERCQYYHLPLLKNSKKILVIGGGTGKIVSQIHRHAAFEELTYVDCSAKMLEKAKMHVKQRCPEIEQKIKFEKADILTEFEASGFDAIVAPFVLDCFTGESLRLLGIKLKKWLTPNGLLLFSDFHESQKPGISRLLSRCITRPLYFALNLICEMNIKQLPDYELMFNPLPLTKTSEHLSFGGILQSVVFRLDQWR